MKKAIITFAVAVILISACNQKQSKDHSGMEHPTANVMMQAMDKSMEAMHSAKQTGNPDYDFAAMMVPHHEGAIVMAEAIVKDSKSDSLVSFSKKVILAQKAEVKLFQNFLRTASKMPSKEANHFKKEMDKAMMLMMKGMSSLQLTGNIDKDFVVLMISHHQSAVDMAKAYIPYSNNVELKNLAEQILTSQSEEITWLKKH